MDPVAHLTARAQRPARHRRPGLVLALAGAFGCPAAAQTRAGPEAAGAADAVQRVEIVGTTPLPGLGTPLRDVPAAVQTFGSRDLARQQPGSLTAFLENNPAGVSVNAAQGNPYQTDISFRGFTASPLVGVPQGLSVFQDGVRINEPFGDVVNWDLLAPSAIATIQLIPGSNPLFGLNTLGGALVIHTRNGRDDPGSAIEVSGGSFGRRTLQLEHGAAAGAWDRFLTAHASRDHGWAQHNASRVAQFFGKAGHQSGRDRLEVSLTAADNRLEGTQTLPSSFLDDRTQAYTYPDISTHRLAMLAVSGRFGLAGGALLTANAYVRRLHGGNVSSNVNDDFGAIDPDSGEADTVQALNDRSTVEQSGAGAAAQLTLTAPLAGRRNQLVLGVALDAGRARYTQESQPASFDDSRGTVPAGDFERETDAATRGTSVALYATDTLRLDDRWTLTASGRLNHSRIRIRDRSGTNPDLDGDHRFQRFNPALGLTFNPQPGLTAYAGYSEGMRAPTAAELTCADPAAPCKLPNAFLADPPLRRVVARTWEFGARGRSGAGASWSAAVYRSDIEDDIQFVSSGGGTINAGYFRNVGATRRQGLELTAAGTWGTWTLAARYGLVQATYRAGFVENSPAHSNADANGDIRVASGSRIPGIPRHSLRLRADWQPADGFSVGAQLLASAGSRLRGDESNDDARGPVPGYAVLHLDARWRIGRHAELFGRIDNVLDRRYANFGVLGVNVFANPARGFDPAGAVAEPFYGLGAPRGAWVGVRLEWD